MRLSRNPAKQIKNKKILTVSKTGTDNWTRVSTNCAFLESFPLSERTPSTDEFRAQLTAALVNLFTATATAHPLLNYRQEALRVSYIKKFIRRDEARRRRGFER